MCREEGEGLRLKMRVEWSFWKKIGRSWTDVKSQGVTQRINKIGGNLSFVLIMGGKD